MKEPNGRPFTIVGLARDRESPENPGALDKRVALIPDDVKRLSAHGCRMHVETGAGAGLGFSNRDYELAGAVIQSAEELYVGKDLIIKLKGPAIEDVMRMTPGCTLLCMAHFHSFPERACALETRRVNVIAMELIVEAPAVVDEKTVVARMAVAHGMESLVARNLLPATPAGVLGYSETLQHAARRLSDMNPASVRLFHHEADRAMLQCAEPGTVLFHHSEERPVPPETLRHLDEKDCRLYDIAAFEKAHRARALEYYTAVHPPEPFGKRRIQGLHETGMAGARYGLRLLREESPLRLKPDRTNVVVLGYGNVGMGAVDECYRQGVRVVHILGPTQTAKGRIEDWLAQADLVVNGAEQPPELRGKNYLITCRHVKEVTKKGAVIIDLVGGSATNRSPVEPVVECTYLTNPHFVSDGVFISALWGWPMMGMMRESAVLYSGQIVDVLLHTEKLILGLDHLALGVRPALVCRPEAPTPTSH